MNSEGYKYAQQKKLASVRPGMILPPFPQPVTYTAPFDLPSMPAPQLFNSTGQEIAIKGWKGPRWNFNYGFTAENFARAVEPYLKNIDSIEINGIIPGMGIAERSNPGTGGRERCLFIPEKLLEMDPGLNGLNDLYPYTPHFTLRSIMEPALLSSQRMTDLLSTLLSIKGASRITRENMVKAMRMKYGIARPAKECELEKIAHVLKATKQWASVLLIRSEKFLRCYGSASSMLEETQRPLSALISWLLEHRTKISVAELKQTLLGLNLAGEKDTDHILPWLSLVDSVAPGGLRFINQGLPGDSLTYIKEKASRTKHLELQTISISSEQRVKRENRSYAHQEIAALIRQNGGKLSCLEIARLRGSEVNTVRQIIDRSGKFGLVGPSTYVPLADHPELRNVPFPRQVKRRAWIFAAIRHVLKEAPMPLTTREIHNRLKQYGYIWSFSSVKRLLSDKNYSARFVSSEGRYSLKPEKKE